MCPSVIVWGYINIPTVLIDDGMIYSTTVSVVFYVSYEVIPPNLLPTIFRYIPGDIIMAVVW